jgi:arsenite-transporting ATPase
MAPRTILYTGKGGVGKTSVAAATARRCAASGRRTLVLSTDPAHSLADLLEGDVGSAPTAVAADRSAQQVTAQEELERHWSAVRAWLAQVLVDRGVDRIAAEELTVPPGGDELFSLLELRRHVEEGGWDVIVVDCAPTGETLRLLSFPEAARWWLGKLLGRETQLLAAARPLARAFLDLSLPDEAALAEVQRLIRSLVAMHELLCDRRSVSLRLVMTPDRVVVAEAMRTFTYLSLYGYLTDAVVVNRVFPEALADGYFGSWRELQQRELERVHAGFGPVPLLQAPYFEAEVVGAAMLDRLAAALFGDDDPAAILHDDLAQDFRISGDEGELRLALPFARKGDVSLKRVGEELVVRVDAGGSARSCCRRRSPRCARRARRSTAARWWCALAAEGEYDALARVREHLDDAHAAADRLVQEAHRRAEEAARAAAADVPPCGWEAPRDERGRGLPDVSPLLALLDAVRRSVPPELSRQLAEALRELLLALRALIDWYLERLDAAPGDGAPVEDIPID